MTFKKCHLWIYHIIFSHSAVTVNLHFKTCWILWILCVKFFNLALLNIKNNLQMHFQTLSGPFLYIHLLNMRSDAVWRIFRGLILTAFRGLRLSSALSCGPMLCHLSRGGSDMNGVYRPPAEEVEGIMRNQKDPSHRTAAGALGAADEFLRTKIESGGRRGEEPAYTSNGLLRFCVIVAWRRCFELHLPQTLH